MHESELRIQEYTYNLLEAIVNEIGPVDLIFALEAIYDTKSELCQQNNDIPHSDFWKYFATKFENLGDACGISLEEHYQNCNICREENHD